MKRRLLTRFIISLLGAVFILWGAMSVALGVFGQQATAVVTHIRREGGERADIRPGQYTYNISYTFTLPDGRKVNGFTKKIGDAIYMKADGTATTKIRYYKGFPYFNAMEKDTGLGVGPLVLILAGGIVIILINRSK